MSTAANPAVTQEVPPQEQIIIDWQPTGDDGKPLGRPTRIVAKDYSEALDKMKEITQAAQREMFRLRSLKPQFNPETPAVSPRPLEGDEAKKTTDALLSQNPSEVQAAVKKLVETELGLSVEDIQALKEERSRVARQAETFRFLSAHPSDYNNTQANASLLREYLESNNLAWTATNLEIAFSALRDELIPVERAATEVPAHTANPVEHRKAPSGSEPGQRAPRQVQGFTREDAIKMAKEKTTAELQRWLNQPGNREKFEAALNSNRR